MVPIVLAIMLLLLAGIHLYWAAGGLIGRGHAIPEVHGQPVFKPSRLSTVAVAFALISAAFVAMLRGFSFCSSIPSWLTHWASITIGIVFSIRAIGDFHLIGFFKRARGTVFASWDTWLFSPMCILIAIAFFSIAAR
jgi:Protein of unknown function (DUF3995)